ncbi:MAG: DUF222 domain-containing protein, partial [Solirubrobacterales bacterium]|nr:DUF222 domain-containing protein [Solirubrobacterales bacterium]
MCSARQTIASSRNAAFEPACEGPRRSLADLEQEIRALGAHIAAATCRWLLLIAEFDERGGWAEWGIKSCAHWLSWRCSLGLSTAREHVRVARRLAELPLVREAFARGQLSYCKVRAITRVAEPQIEAELVELARHATGAQLDNVVRGCVRAIRATEERARDAFQERSLSWSFDHDGSLQFEGKLPADEGALLLCALEAASDTPLYGASRKDASAEAPAGATPYQRRADALVTLARAGLAAADTKRSGGDPCELVLHIDEATLSASRIVDRSELTTPGSSADPLPVAPETARRPGCDASLVPIIERAGAPLSVGRRRRTVPPAMRRALRARDRGCRFPGCTHTRFLHAHHIRHWANGGHTRLDNLIELCSHHHRLVHEGGYAVERAGRRARFHRPDGRAIPHAPPAQRARGPGLERRNRDAGLEIAPTTCTPLSAGGRIDYDIAVSCLLTRR